MVHNSTNINTTSNHFSFQTNEHKNTTTFGVGNSGPCLGLRKHVAGLHPLMGSTPPPPLIIRTPTKTHTHTHTHIYKQTIINLYRFAPMQKHHTLSEKTNDSIIMIIMDGTIAESTNARSYPTTS